VTTGEPLSAEDAALLYAEAPGTQLQIGALCFFEGAPLRDRRGRLRNAALRSHVAARLDGLPRFRQRIAPAIADVAAPTWVDDTDFDIARHCKVARLAPPGGPEALRQFMDRLLGRPLDPAHPLWDIHVVEGVDGARPGGESRAGGADAATDAATDTVAVVVRAHHVMADGIALHAAATLLLDPEPRAPRTTRHTWSTQPAPGALELTARALGVRGRRQADLALAVGRELLDPRRAPANARRAARAVAAVRGGLPATAPSLPITAPVGPHRAFAWGSVPMEGITAVKVACGATVNDVVLAITTGALRRHLEATSSFDPAARRPRALIPIGDPATAADMRNRFSIRSVDLPVDEDDPLERVRAIHSLMHPPDTPAGGSLMPHLFSVADVVPPRVLRAVVPPLLARQPLVNLAVSDIPGSRLPLYLWESRMLGLHPFINVVGNVALIVGVLSYVDDLGIGVTVDRDVVGDPQPLADHLRAAYDELVGLVPRHHT
jgi:diacylglycerol O-acyltransferase